MTEKNNQKLNCNSQVKIGDVVFSNNEKLSIMAGPCQIESKQHAFDMAGALKEIADKFSIGLIYKSSFDKANRTSLESHRGIGLEKALDVFADLKKHYNIAIVTDVHLPEQCAQLAPIVDILQIPAFLCRQTDLLLAAAKTGKVVNVKKGQFLAPWDMKNVVNKIIAGGNRNILLCERGTSFGYNTLINDMRGLEIMAKFGAPVIFDATHSVQQPGGLGSRSGGQCEYVAGLARAAAAVGVAGIFAETHQDPNNAPSDGANMITPQQLEQMLEQLLAIDDIVKNMHKEKQA